MKALETKALSVRWSAAEALERLIGVVPALIKAANFVNSRGGLIVVTGIGKSSFIAEKFVATLKSLGRRAVFLHPVEALHGDLGIISKNDVLVALSFSGESKEVIKIVTYVKIHFKIPVFSFTGNKFSSLAKLSTIPIILDVKSEGSPHNLAPMASTTATMVACDMFSSMIMNPGFKVEHFAKFHPGGSLGLSFVRVEERMSHGKSLPVVAAKDSLKSAVKELNKKRRGYRRSGIVAVINNLGKLVGVITDGDVSAFFQKHESISGILVKDVMTLSPKTITEGSSLKEALTLMEKFKITILLVVNSKDKLTGILHIHQVFA